MRKTALTILSALLISGLAVQMAAAASQHHRSKAYVGRDLSDFRGAYNSDFSGAYDQVYGAMIVAPPILDRFDPSRPGGEDPDLKPSGS